MPDPEKIDCPKGPLLVLTSPDGEMTEALGQTALDLKRSTGSDVIVLCGGMTLDAIEDDDLASIGLARISTLADQATANADGPTHRGDPETSRIAARHNGVANGSQRQRVLDRLAWSPATDHEVAAMLHIPYSSAGTRRHELETLGLVVSTPERRPTALGNPAVVWKVTSLGLRVLSHLKGGADRWTPTS